MNFLFSILFPIVFLYIYTGLVVLLSACKALTCTKGAITLYNPVLFVRLLIYVHHYDCALLYCQSFCVSTPASSQEGVTNTQIIYLIKYICTMPAVFSGVFLTVLIVFNVNMQRAASAA